MPSLDFKGKQFVYTHHLSVPFREIVVHPKKSVGAKPGLADNLIIHGDNLHALKALLPTYAGKVKCIYIDPPYNTGKENWCFNDNVRGPLIQEWLKKSANPVDKDDLERHDKWLCMMWPRLQLLKELLCDDGVIFVSIDDNELERLVCLMNEIFGEKNKLQVFIWEIEGNFDNQARFKTNHEYVLLYAKNAEQVGFPKAIDPTIPDTSKLYRPEIRNSIVKTGSANPVSEVTLPNGFPADFEEGIIPARDHKWPKIAQDIQVKEHKVAKAVKVASGWANRNLFQEFIDAKFENVKDSKGQSCRFVLTHTGTIDCIKDRSAEQSYVTSILRGLGTTEREGNLLKAMGIKFPYPKPHMLVRYLIEMYTSNGDVVLDSFAGSGTTGHAAMLLNHEKNRNLKVILVECESYAEKITATRFSKIIKGFSAASSKLLKNGLGGTFTFCTLGDEINIETLLKGGKLPDYEALARYVFYTATGQTLERVGKHRPDFRIGETENYTVHLVYGPDRDFLRSADSALNAELVKQIAAARKKSKKALVFATAKFMGQKELSELGIEFCQLPYAIHRILGD